MNDFLKSTGAVLLGIYMVVVWLTALILPFFSAHLYGLQQGYGGYELWATVVLYGGVSLIPCTFIAAALCFGFNFMPYFLVFMTWCAAIFSLFAYDSNLGESFTMIEWHSIAAGLIIFSILITKGIDSFKVLDPENKKYLL